ncbi:MAG: flavin reductase family protein [Paracoccaceae bacterium]
MTNKPQHFQPGPETHREYRDALGRFGTGVTVVTTGSASGPIGITANSFSSVSLDPPLVLWSQSKKSKRYPHFAEADRIAIHVLSEHQTHLCHTFAKPGFSFDALDWTQDPDGTPLIEGCLARFECQRYAMHDGGDHMIIVARVLRTTLRDGAPLLVYGGSLGGFADIAASTK